MVIYESVQILKQKGVYCLALKTGLIPISIDLKVRVYDFWKKCKHKKNKDKIQETAAQLEISPKTVYEYLSYIKNN